MCFAVVRYDHLHRVAERVEREAIEQRHGRFLEAMGRLGELPRTGEDEPGARVDPEAVPLATWHALYDEERACSLAIDIDAHHLAEPSPARFEGCLVEELVRAAKAVAHERCMAIEDPAVLLHRSRGEKLSYRAMVGANWLPFASPACAGAFARSMFECLRATGSDEWRCPGVLDESAVMRTLRLPGMVKAREPHRMLSLRACARYPPTAGDAPWTAWLSRRPGERCLARTATGAGFGGAPAGGAGRVPALAPREFVELGARLLALAAKGLGADGWSAEFANAVEVGDRLALRFTSKHPFCPHRSGERASGHVECLENGMRLEGFRPRAIDAPGAPAPHRRGGKVLFSCMLGRDGGYALCAFCQSCDPSFVPFVRGQTPLPRCRLALPSSFPPLPPTPLDPCDLSTGAVNTGPL